MARFLYTLLYYCLSPFLFIRLLVKHRKSHAYKEQRQSLRLLERLGIFSKPPPGNNPVWLHTVSVGEFIAALPLIRKIRADYPHYPLLITCTTTTGSAQIIKTFAQEIQQKKIIHVYLPYDLPGAMQRFLQTIQPRLGIIMETEIWPNLLHTASKLMIPMCLLNARLSARSVQGYRRIMPLIQPAIEQFSVLAAQHEQDAQRLLKLGANEQSLTTTGSIKFDIQLNQDDIRAGKALRKQLCWLDKKVLIAASTHKGEDEILLSIYRTLKQQYPQLKLIVVPRHPERFQTVYQLLQGENIIVVKRSELSAGFEPLAENSIADILLGDSMGEMIRYFSCADIVFMGGTLLPTGGHNILEPAALGLPIVYGSYMFNFNAINDLFLQHQAALQLADQESLLQALDGLISDKDKAGKMAHNARQLITQNSGAVNKMMALLKPYLV